MKIGVIGTAGRDCLDKLDSVVYDKMAVDLRDILLDICSYSGGSIELVSGGAAWADHLAVRIYLKDTVLVESIHLYLPCVFYTYSNVFNNSKEGKTLNYYHSKFSSKVCDSGVDLFYSRKQLSQVIEDKANYTLIPGFKNRNIEVGKVDVLVAYTFGKKVPLNNTGTWHCWKNSVAKRKIHRCISDL
jgi:hypothetical protein